MTTVKTELPCFGTCCRSLAYVAAIGCAGTTANSASVATDSSCSTRHDVLHEQSAVLELAPRRRVDRLELCTRRSGHLNFTDCCKADMPTYVGECRRVREGSGAAPTAQLHAFLANHTAATPVASSSTTLAFLRLVRRAACVGLQPCNLNLSHSFSRSAQPCQTRAGRRVKSPNQPTDPPSHLPTCAYIRTRCHSPVPQAEP